MGQPSRPSTPLHTLAGLRCLPFILRKESSFSACTVPATLPILSWISSRRKCTGMDGLLLPRSAPSSSACLPCFCQSAFASSGHGACRSFPQWQWSHASISQFLGFGFSRNPPGIGSSATFRRSAALMSLDIAVANRAPVAIRPYGRPSTAPLVSFSRCMLLRSTANRIGAPTRAAALGLTRPQSGVPSSAK